MGLAASQVAAVARLLAADGPFPSHSLIGIGPEASAAAMAAAILEPDAISGVSTYNSLDSFDDLQSASAYDWTYLYLWVPGLRATADVSDLRALVAPRPVHAY